MMPSTMLVDQNTHRHVVLSAILCCGKLFQDFGQAILELNAYKAPQIGANTGPSNGASEYTAMAFPLSSGLKQSPITPPPIAKGALPPNPARNRNAINWSLFCAKPHPKFHAKHR